MEGGRLGRRIAELIGWGAVAGVGGVMVTQAVGWDGHRLISTLQALTPYGIPLVVIVAAVALSQCWRPLACTAAVVGLGALILAAPIVFGGDQPVPRTDAVGVTAASVNLLYSNPRIDDLADELVELDPDVVAFSEFTFEHQWALAVHPLAERYPYQINQRGLLAGGMALWSKYPVDEIPRLDPIDRTIDATLEGPDGTIRILAVHPPTPIFDHPAWTRELRRIGESADMPGDPTLVIGDFNASYWHPAFRDLLRRGLTDAHIANGDGWSTSWPTDEVLPPFVRLDHALTGHGLVSTAVDDVRLPGTDHAAFVVTVKPAAS